MKNDFFLPDPSEYPELTIKELRRELHLQSWILQNLKRIWLPTEYKVRKWENENANVKTSAEDYINGLINEEEYSEKKRVENWQISVNRDREQRWADRLYWLESRIIEQEALISEILDLLEQKEADDIRAPKKRKRHKPFKYKYNHGYDPRRNANDKNVRPQGAKEIEERKKNDGKRTLY